MQNIFSNCFNFNASTIISSTRLYRTCHLALIRRKAYGYRGNFHFTVATGCTIKYAFGGIFLPKFRKIRAVKENVLPTRAIECDIDNSVDVFWSEGFGSDRKRENRKD